MPALIIVGSHDCVNVPDLPLRGIDTYAKLASQRKALVIMRGANHCFFATPVAGSCAYDSCTAVPRLDQQAAGLKIFRRFAMAAFSTSAVDWQSFEEFLAGGHDPETGIEWQAWFTASGNSKVPLVGPFSFPLCPVACCSDSLAVMGLCHQV